MKCEASDTSGTEKKTKKTHRTNANLDTSGTQSAKVLRDQVSLTNTPVTQEI